MKTYSVILIGAGHRGMAYTNIMKTLPEKFKVVAVADTVEGRRKYVQQQHNLPDEKCFSSWEEILARPKMADIALICTMDNLHYAPAMKAIELGYNLLLEKPAAQTAQQCVDIALAAKKKGVKALVCHVLRYTPFFGKIKQLVMSGIIGEPMSVLQVEAVGNIHQSHSYVRGNWHSAKETTPMLLAKSCHDIDMIQWLLEKPCKSVQSFGDLTYFTEKNAPEGAPVRCIDGGCPIEDTCPYNCRKLYYENKHYSMRLACTLGIAKGEIPTDEEVMLGLQTKDYGLCVFHANNDVVDHQVVNMEFEGGVTASFTMNAFNFGGRYIRIFGTQGELYAKVSDSKITVYNFVEKAHKEIPVVETDESINGGHGGGDEGIINELYEYLNGDYKGFRAADIETSVRNHLIVFAAEKSRHNKTVEDMDAFFESYGMSVN